MANNHVSKGSIAAVRIGEFGNLITKQNSLFRRNVSNNQSPKRR